MRCYLVRHAISVERTADQADATRPLTSEGRRRMVTHAAALAGLGVTLDVVWTSPLVRARQTAEVLLESLQCPRLRVVDDLAPEGDLVALVSAMLREPVRDVALVGHEPDLSELAALLLTGRRGAGMRLKKGGVARVDVDPLSHRAVMKWWLTPRQMRSMVH